jgi:NitT/TauT family transport system permease protein
MGGKSEVVARRRRWTRTAMVPTPARLRKARHRAFVHGLQALVAFGFLALWQVLVRWEVLDPFFFSRPTDVANRVIHWIGNGRIWPDLQVTMIESLYALFLGGVLGILAGFLLARFQILAEISNPFIATFNALPRIVFAPMFIIWFGLGMSSKVALGVSLVFFIVFYNTFNGVRDVDQTVLNNTRMLGASGFQQVTHVMLPSAMSWILASLQTSIGFAISGAVVGEYLGSNAGIGYVIANAQGVFDVTGVMAGVVVLSGAVIVITMLVNRIENHLLRWK